MDGMAPESAAGQSSYSKILDRFVAAVHSAPNTVRRIIWDYLAGCLTLLQRSQSQCDKPD